MWSDAELRAAKWDVVPEDRRGRWTLLALRSACNMAAAIFDRQRGMLFEAFARAFRAAGAALVE